MCALRMDRFTASVISTASTIGGRINAHKQICYMNPSSMTELNLNFVGTSAVLVSQGNTFLVYVWPRKEMLSNHIEFWSIVYKSSTPSIELAIKPIEIGDINQLNVTVVFTDSNEVLKWREQYNSTELVNFLKQILHDLCIDTTFSVDTQNIEIAKLLGIEFLYIDSCDKCGIVTADTEISIKNLVSNARYEQLISQKQNLGGLDSAVKMLKDLILLWVNHRVTFSQVGLTPPRGVLLQGPPGCGKTSLVKHIAQDIGAYVIVINGPEFLGSRPGETTENLRDAFKFASNQSDEGPCILFIDEVDSLCPQTSKGAEEARISSQICALMDVYQNIMVIGATNRPTSVHASLRRPGRFDRELFIGVPNVMEREQILISLTSQLAVDVDVNLALVAESTKGYVGADLTQLCREAAYIRFSSAPNEVLPNICMSDFRAAVRNVRPSTQRGSEALVDYRSVHWADIGGLSQVKADIRQAIEWPILHPEAFTRMGIQPPRGVLLYGPPGCCKTTLVRAAATAAKVTFLSVSGAQIFSPYVGDSERLINQVFYEARMGAPSILFLDELESVVGTRSSGQTGVQERVLSTLLNLMDGIGVQLSERTSNERLLEGEAAPLPSDDVKHVPATADHVPRVVLVGATNRPDLIDDALLRPGRIDKIIYVPPPDLEARREILRLLTSRMAVSADVDHDWMAEMTENFTGADLENLCQEAGLRALTVSDLQCTEVGHEHFVYARGLMSASLTAEQLAQYSCYLPRR